MRARNWEVSVVVLSLVFVFGMESPATAATINFVANIDGVCAASGSSATGLGVFTLNTSTGVFTWHIEFTGLGSDEQFAHIHGPIDVACGSFGSGFILVDLGIGSPKDGSKVLSAEQQQGFLDGKYYVNIHTEEFGSGEISGVILQEEFACCHPDFSCTVETSEGCGSLSGVLTESASCDGIECATYIPTVSEWGMALFALLVLISGTLAIRSRCLYSA